MAPGLDALGNADFSAVECTIEFRKNVREETMSKRFVDMSDRRGEIPKMMEILASHKDWKSLTFFQYKGGNADLVKPITRIRLAKRLKSNAATEFVLSIGTPNYDEREYIKKFVKGQARMANGRPQGIVLRGPDRGCWPDDTYEMYPKKKKKAA